MQGIIKPSIAIGPMKQAPTISLSELYHENTKLHPLTAAESGLVPLATYTAEEKQAMSRAYKQYPSASRVKLPEIDKSSASNVLFDDVILSRRSVRNFTDAELGVNDLSKILYQSYGITEKTAIPGGGSQFFRSAPSAGALYPAEIYLGIRRVTGLSKGIYHYKVLGHELELLIPGDPTDQLYSICCQQEYVRQVSVVILISGVLQRTKRKYGERGYRLVFLDVGHLGQNIYLACTALGLSVMTTCGFFDDEANQLLRLDGVDETMLYVAFVGK
ncbi:MAG: SagB/ThcOx family dehydrogenase [Nitrospinales bacterium]